MKEEIQKIAGEVAIVIYDAPLPPRYFRFTKKFIRTFFVVAPLIILVLFSLLLFWGLGSRLKDAPKPSLPAALNVQDTRVQELESELETLRATNTQITQKLSGQPALPTGTDEPYLLSVKKPYGMQNLLSENRIKLDQFEFVQEASGVAFKFQIISSDSDKKVTGHILVAMLSDSGMMMYPPEANAQLAQGVKYSAGETFAVSRLRPTNATFAFKPKSENVRFVVTIFSREGDLLLIRETEPFKVNAK
jgi:hypothetical protein